MLLHMLLFGVFASNYAPFWGVKLSFKGGDNAREILYATLWLLTLPLSPCNMYASFTSHFRLI